MSVSGYMKDLVKETLRRSQLLGIASLIYRAANPRSLYHNIPYWLKRSTGWFTNSPVEIALISMG